MGSDLLPSAGQDPIAPRPTLLVTGRATEDLPLTIIASAPKQAHTCLGAEAIIERMFGALLLPPGATI